MAHARCSIARIFHSPRSVVTSTWDYCEKSEGEAALYCFSSAPLSLSLTLSTTTMMHASLLAFDAVNQQLSKRETRTKELYNSCSQWLSSSFKVMKMSQLFLQAYLSKSQKQASSFLLRLLRFKASNTLHRSLDLVQVDDGTHDPH